MCESGEAAYVTQKVYSILSCAITTDPVQINSAGSSNTYDVSLNSNVLAKELFWFIKVDKYSNGTKFLAYQPIYDKEQDTTALRQRASGRWVLRFCAYEAKYEWVAADTEFQLQKVAQIVNGTSTNVPEIEYAKSPANEADSAYFDI